MRVLTGSCGFARPDPIQAKVVRTLSLDEQSKIKSWAEKYVKGSRIYLERK